MEETLWCEHCGRPIDDGEEWYMTDDDVSLHEKCYPRKQFLKDTRVTFPSGYATPGVWGHSPELDRDECDRDGDLMRVP